jgi:hypothetical protein
MSRPFHNEWIINYQNQIMIDGPPIDRRTQKSK